MPAASEIAYSVLAWLHGASTALTLHPLLCPHHRYLQQRRRLIRRPAAVAPPPRLPCLHLQLCQFNMPPQGRGS